MALVKRLEGRRFGRLRVLWYIGKASNGNACWACRCSCGTRLIVVSGSLLSGHTKSCGCLRLELTRARSTKHGHSRSSPRHPATKEYRAWYAMIYRCTNANEKCFHRYGGRGIRVCRRWRRFENFLADMGRAPSRKHSIDRIDNNGNYEPGNVRWATPLQQARNR